MQFLRHSDGNHPRMFTTNKTLTKIVPCLLVDGAHFS